MGLQSLGQRSYEGMFAGPASCAAQMQASSYIGQPLEITPPNYAEPIDWSKLQGFFSAIHGPTVAAIGVATVGVGTKMMPFYPVGTILGGGLVVSGSIAVGAGTALTAANLTGTPVEDGAIPSSLGDLTEQAMGRSTVGPYIGWGLNTGENFVATFGIMSLPRPTCMLPTYSGARCTEVAKNFLTHPISRESGRPARQGYLFNHYWRDLPLGGVRYDPTLHANVKYLQAGLDPIYLELTRDRVYYDPLVHEMIVDAVEASLRSTSSCVMR